MRKIIKLIRLKLFNKKNKTNLKSVNASLYAKYGKGVLIDRNTIIDSDVSIGNYSYVNRDSSLENCVVGNYCSISSLVYINPYEHALKFRSTHPFCDVGREKRKKVVIGNDVLISLNCIILEGVNIGDGAVIAAGAVVTKDVAPYEIVGGVPAKHIGWRFDQEEIKRIQDTKWWEYDKDFLQSNLPYFNLERDNFIKN